MIKRAYEKFVLPKVLDVCCSTKPITYQRNKIVPNAEGTILEIGIGSGLNIPYYQKSNIKKIYGLDPSPELCEIAKKTAHNNKIEIDFLIEGAEEIKLPSKSIDTVLITYTLCSIPNPDDALKEIKRVMKHDGKILFCEHGAAPDLSDGSYGIPEGIMFSYPLRSLGNYEYEVVQSLELNEFGQQKVQATREELQMEREAVSDIMG